MIDTTISYLNRLPNNEFQIAFTDILSRLEEEEFEVDVVKSAYEMAQTHIISLRFLRERRRQHENTGKILKLKVDRHLALTSFKGRVNKSLNSPVELEQKAAESLDMILFTYRKYFMYPTLNAQRSMIENMGYEVQDKPTLTANMETLGLDVTWGYIVIKTREMGELYLNREKEIKADKEKALAIRTNAYNAVKTFFTTVEIALKLEKGVKKDHLRYMTTMENAMSNFKRDFEARKTRRINLALAEAEKEIEDALGNNGTPVIAMRMPLMGGNVAKGGETPDEGLLRMTPTDAQQENVVTLHDDGATNGSDKSQKTGA